MSDPTPTVEPAADAENRHDPGAARTGAVIPQQPQSSADARVYVTPSWVNAPRPQRARRALEQLLPQQADPEHDQLTSSAPGETLDLAGASDLAEHGHWVGPRTGRAVVGTVVVILLAGAVYAAFRVVATHSTASIVLTLLCCLLAAGVFAMMSTSRPTVVDLDGTTLRVRHTRGHESFELADPCQEVVVRGEPGTPAWTIALGRPGGSALVLDGRTVDSAALAPVVAAARALAARRRAARDERFDR